MEYQEFMYIKEIQEIMLLEVPITIEYEQCLKIVHEPAHYWFRAVKS